jgi:hypothetical protein
MNQREARVLKSPHLPECSTFFQITVRVFAAIDCDERTSFCHRQISFQDDGIRDIDESELMEQDRRLASQENVL